MSVKTKIGTKFIEMVKEEFPPDHPYHHILNEHTVKFSYSVMPNLKKKINNHNVKIANEARKANKNTTKNVGIVGDEEYDPEEEIDYEDEEIVPDAIPVVEDPITQLPLEPVLLNARACDGCDEHCGGLIVDNTTTTTAATTTTKAVQLPWRSTILSLGRKMHCRRRLCGVLLHRHQDRHQRHGDVWRHERLSEETSIQSCCRRTGLRQAEQHQIIWVSVVPETKQPSCTIYTKMEHN